MKKPAFQREHYTTIWRESTAPASERFALSGSYGRCCCSEHLSDEIAKQTAARRGEIPGNGPEKND